MVGGSRDMPGAPVLSSIAALRAGAGLVTRSHLDCTASDTRYPEVMLRVLPAPGGVYADDHLFALKKEKIATIGAQRMEICRSCNYNSN